MTQEQFKEQMLKFNEELTALNTPIRVKQQEYEKQFNDLRKDKEQYNFNIDQERHRVFEIQEELRQHKECKPIGEGMEAEREVWRVEYEQLHERLNDSNRKIFVIRDCYNQTKLQIADVRAAWCELERMRKANATRIWNEQHAFILDNPKDQIEDYGK